MGDPKPDANQFIDEIRLFAQEDSFARLLKWEIDEVSPGSCKMHVKIETSHLSFNKGISSLAPSDPVQFFMEECYLQFAMLAWEWLVGNCMSFRFTY